MQRTYARKKALARHLRIPVETIADFVAAGILPPGGKWGWPIIECQHRLTLYREAGSWTPRWLLVVDELSDLMMAASKALDAAVAAPSPDACRTAADAGNRLFRLWSFVVAALEGRPDLDPLYREAALNTAMLNYGRVLIALGTALEAREAVVFLH